MDDNQWEENGARICVSAVVLAFEDTEIQQICYCLLIVATLCVCYW